ncbi:nucleotidyltransferase family protein [Paraburkholderia sp. HP33-1]|uniref:nucleotidyltransferase family protein n=1 Tax=Paraburkholderia sp. HP33-1 TaxID=2883243 RepID=UPI001F47D30B|nr:nucleotidyltransferase family protein [Paraburkholderia sp. HP33-1]
MNSPLPCLILAGGFGTRLRSVLGDECPKALAPIGGRPFLGWLLQALARQGVPEAVLSLGFGRDSIRDFVASSRPDIAVSFVEEREPLGTGGAIIHALRSYGVPATLVMNGDTLCEVDLSALSAHLQETDADIVMAATHVADASRYGTIDIDAKTGRLAAFKEKHEGAGLINAGVYAINATRLLSRDFPEKFSFERDFLEKSLSSVDVRVYAQVGEFIDIGVPQDYARAQTFIPQLFQASVDEA